MIHQKVTASLVAGAITGLLVAEAKRRGFPIEPDEAADVTVLLSFIAGYFMPNGDSGDAAEPVPAPAPAVLVPPPAPAPVPPPAAPIPPAA